MVLRSIAAALAGLGATLGAVAQSAPFPRASAEQVGLAPASLRELSDAVRLIVDQDEVVGVELLVIKDHKTVLHEVFGFKDRESKTPMAPDTIFCVRSMTKPLAGTAIQMLADDGKLALNDRAAKHLPVLQGTACEPTTIEQLLTHRAGLPLSLINKPFSDYDGRDGIVRQIAEQGPMLDIGKQFSYSDCGADTLGSVVDHVSGEPLEKFIQQRILDPLGMQETLTVVREGDPRRGRISSNYMGERGNWTRYWKNTDPPIFPFMLASQSLYSTPADYARFMSLWMDGGTVDGRRLLSQAAVTRALTPVGDMTGIPTTINSLKLLYGQLWMLYTDPRDEKQVIAFGHGGSDGTGAWAFPKLGLIVCCFTQARMSTALSSVESVLDRRFAAPLVGSSAKAPPETPAARELDEICGLYWSERDGIYRAITRDGPRLMLELPGIALVELAEESKDHWAIKLAQSQKLAIQRDEQGRVTGLVADTGTKTAVLPRVTPGAGLPTLDEIVALHIKGHHSEGLSQLAPFRRTGTVDMPARGMKGTIDGLIAPPRRVRSDTDLGSVRQLNVMDGDSAWMVATGQPVRELKGAEAEQVALDNPVVLFGDFRSAFKEVQVVGRAERDGEPVVVLRAVPRAALPTALIISAKTGLLLEQERLVKLPGLGTVGVNVSYEDLRDVGGVLLPFRFNAQYAIPLLGTTTIQFENLELKPALSDNSFARPSDLPAASTKRQ